MIVNTETEAVWLVKIELATYNRSLLVSCQMASFQLEQECTCDFIVVEMQYIIFSLGMSSRACSKKIQKEFEK